MGEQQEIKRHWIPKEMYYKVYADCDLKGNYFVKLATEVSEDFLKDFFEDSFSSGEPMPCLVPVMMTEEEYKDLPEFNGF